MKNDPQTKNIMGSQGPRPSKTGRKGDPRMHRAVAARLQNPELTLLAALRQGGFVFPDNTASDGSCLDGDGVTLGQRKNQLSRRLRLARQSDSKKTDVTNQDSQMEFQKSTKDPTKKRKCTVVHNHDHNHNHDDSEDLSDGTSGVHIDQKPKLYSDHRHLFPPLRQQQQGISLTSDPSSRLLPNANATSVAVASLINSASTVGMTLEQLAMNLSSTPKLFQTLSSNPDPEARLNLAINLYMTDSRALLQKCMLLAGFGSTDITEGSSPYMQVALKIWESEGLRLEQLLGCGNRDKSKGGSNDSFCDCLPRQGNESHHHLNKEGGKNAAIVVDEDSVGNGNARCLDGRHVHRLAGKCGHKAIVHQPAGKPAHVDFVVDGKVECFEGIKPVGPKGRGALWPSRYKCIDLSCPTDPKEQKVACGSDCCDAGICGQPTGEPKELPLADLDLDGKEWNMDFFSHDAQDDTVLGLIKLGDVDRESG